MKLRAHTLASRATGLLAACALVLTTVTVVSAPMVRAQVRVDDLEQRDGLYYAAGESSPFTGEAETAGGSKGRIERGLFAGAWLTYYGSGAVETRAAYEDGKQVLFTVFFESGARSSEMSFRDGVPHGPRRSWYESGSLRQENNFENGRPEGATRILDPNGNLLYLAEYSAGALDGEVSWYYPDGSKRWETHYANGERTGTWVQYGEDGSLFMQSSWKDGVLTERVNPHTGH